MWPCVSWIFVYLEHVLTHPVTPGMPLPPWAWNWSNAFQAPWAPSSLCWQATRMAPEIGSIQIRSLRLEWEELQIWSLRFQYHHPNLANASRTERVECWPCWCFPVFATHSQWTVLQRSGNLLTTFLLHVMRAVLICIDDIVDKRHVWRIYLMELQNVHDTMVHVAFCSTSSFVYPYSFSSITFLQKLVN